MMEEGTRKWISTTTKHGMLKRAQRGENVNQLPLGYIRDEDGKVAIDPENGWKVWTLFQLRKQGWTLQQLQGFCHEARLFSRRGKPLGVSSIHVIVNNPFYRGIQRYRGMRIHSLGPKITS